MEQRYWYKTVDDMIHRILLILAYIASLCLVLLMAVTAANIFTRYILNKPIYGNTEISKYLFLISVAFGLGYTQYNDGNVKVTLLVDALKPKMKRAVQIIVDTVTSLFTLFISFQLISLVQRKLSLGDTTETLKMPEWIFSIILLVSFSLLAICSVWMVIKKVMNINLVNIDTIQNAQVLVQEVDGKQVITVTDGTKVEGNAVAIDGTNDKEDI